MNHKKFSNIAIAIILLAILAGLGGYLFLSKKPVKQEILQQQSSTTTQEETLKIEDKVGEIKETVNWKTYTDTNVGWEIRLPSSYSIGYSIYTEEIQEKIKQQLKEENGVINGNFYLEPEEGSVSEDYSITFVKELDKSFTPLLPFGGDKPAIALTISKIRQKPENVSMFDYVKNTLAKPFFSDVFGTEVTPIENVEKIIIDGKEIVKGSVFVFEGCPTEGYWIEKDKKSYIELEVGFCFTADNDPEKLKKEKDEINKIISTFKFVK